jgi:hypothetical protein
MHVSVTFNDFCDAFRNMNRNDQFSYEGKKVLFDFCESWEEETGQPVELDIIALCCEWYEASWQEIASDYSVDIEGLADDEIEEKVREYVEYNSMIAGDVPGGCVYLAF